MGRLPFGRRSSAAAVLLAMATLASACGGSATTAPTTAPAGTPATTAPAGTPATTAPAATPATSAVPATSTGPGASIPPTSTAGVSAAAIQALINEGITQANGGMTNQAIATFKDVLLLSPKATVAYFNLGLIYQMKHDDKTAIGYYNMAVGVDPTYTPAMYNEAIILESSDLDAALTLYQKIVKINPKASTAFLRMAFVYAKQGKTAEASSARAKAVALDPTLEKFALPAKCTTPAKPNC